MKRGNSSWCTLAYISPFVMDDGWGSILLQQLFCSPLSFSHVCIWCCDVLLVPEIGANMLLVDILVRFGFRTPSTDQVSCIVGCYLSLEIQECLNVALIILSGLLALRDVMNPSLGVMLIAEWSCATFLRFCACWIRIHLQQFTRKQQIWCTVCLVWSMTECFFSLKQFQ